MARGRSLLIFGVVLSAVACAVLDAPCPCGGRWDDPRGGQPYDSRSAAREQSNVAHSRDDHCVCRCGGTGEELFMPPFQSECSAFEVSCIDERGKQALLVCH